MMELPHIATLGHSLSHYSFHCSLHIHGRLFPKHSMGCHPLLIEISCILSLTKTILHPQVIVHALQHSLQNTRMQVLLQCYHLLNSYVIFVFYLYVQNLIDLAGSESSRVETTGVRRKEGSYINKSLLTLGTVRTF